MTPFEEVKNKARYFVKHQMPDEKWFTIKNDLYKKALLELYNEDCPELGFDDNLTKVKKIDLEFKVMKIDRNGNNISNSKRANRNS